MIGAVAKCQHGKVGVICKMNVSGTAGLNHVLYLGVTFDGKAWQSKDPEILASCINDYLNRFYGLEIKEPCAELETHISQGK